VKTQEPYPVIAIVGPTASGKSALAVELARTLGGEVISADSRQVYRGLDIGTGKITKREMRGVPHHLLDVADPRRSYSAGQFTTAARKSIRAIASRGKIPIVAGGTGFYIDALLGRITLPEVVPDKKLRATLATKSPSELFTMLKKKDPTRAASMDTPSERNNAVRLIRALEIASSTNTSRIVTKDTYRVLWLGTKVPLAQLEKKIAQRLKARMRMGMLSEAKRLHKSGLSYKRMEELGLEYRSLGRLLQNKITRSEFDDELLRDIRRYAKRQLAYWKRNTDIKWISPTGKQALSCARTFLKGR